MCRCAAAAYLMFALWMAGSRNDLGELTPSSAITGCQDATTTPIVIGPACSPLTGSSMCNQPQLQAMFACAHPSLNAWACLPEHLFAGRSCGCSALLSA